MRNIVSFVLPAALAASIFAPPAQSAPTKAAAAKKYTAGHGQMAGGNGRFGEVYSFQNHWNEEILGGRYSVEPFSLGTVLSPSEGKKLLILDIALKNPTSSPQWFNDEGTNSITAIDQNGQQYELTAYGQESTGVKGFGPTLNPGQGVGQPDLHDPVRVAGEVDSGAQIEKIIINEGRLDHPGEEVLRYYMSTATKARDGADGDPANVIAPLPENVRDPSDPTGAKSIDPGNGGKPGDGSVCPSESYDYTLDSFGDAPAGFTYGDGPGDDKKFVIATFTIKNATVTQQDVYDGAGGASFEIRDGDGDSFNPTVLLKKSAPDEFAVSQLDAGQSATFRALFAMPSNETPVELIMGASRGRKWQWKLSGQ